jgi:hypothetical protein
MFNMHSMSSAFYILFWANITTADVDDAGKIVQLSFI